MSTSAVKVESDLAVPMAVAQLAVVLPVFLVEREVEHPISAGPPTLWKTVWLWLGAAGARTASTRHPAAPVATRLVPQVGLERPHFISREQVEPPPPVDPLDPSALTRVLLATAAIAAAATVEAGVVGITVEEERTPQVEEEDPVTPPAASYPLVSLRPLGPAL